MQTFVNTVKTIFGWLIWVEKFILSLFKKMKQTLKLWFSGKTNTEYLKRQSTEIMVGFWRDPADGPVAVNNSRFHKNFFKNTTVASISQIWGVKCRWIICSSEKASIYVQGGGDDDSWNMCKVIHNVLWNCAFKY